MEVVCFCGYIYNAEDDTDYCPRCGIPLNETPEEYEERLSLEDELDQMADRNPKESTEK